MRIKALETKKPLGLYIHIPFCIRKCNYCDFLSMPTNEQLVEQYVQALCKEIASYKENAAAYVVRSIFIGGGTPSSIPEHYIEKILTTVREHVTLLQEDGEDGIPEITMEANPGTLSLEKLKCYKRAGINRLSIGLQSIHNDQLKLLGRIHTYEEFVSNYNLAREVGFDNINIDLISALPGQTLEDWKETLENVISLHPEHISAYSLIIEEGTPFYEIYGKGQGENLLPTEEVERSIYSLTKELLFNAGYERYEISNYARTGYESKHNSSYWKGIEYLGFGLGASSLFQKERFSNETDIKFYLDQITNHKSIRRDVELLTQKQQMEEFMFLGLRMMEGISIEEFTEKFEVDIMSIYGNTIKRFVESGFMSQSKESISLTEKGIDVSNQIFAEFLLD